MRLSLLISLLCLSTTINCLEAPECFESGECVDSFVVGVGLRETPEDCLGFCLETDACQYFTHYSHDRTCLALGNCLTYAIDGCEDCVSGTRNCTLYNGPSILMVMGGFNGTALSTVDAIDLSGQERSCVQPNQLPFSMEDAMAFTVHGKPVVCGGFRDTDFVRNCTIYSPESDEWNFLADSVSEHTYGGGIQLDEGRFWITGGLNENIERIITTEIFSNGAFSSGPDLPEPLSSHCMFWLNKTHIGLTGGWGVNSSAVLSAYLFDVNTEEWTRLGDTIFKHYRHGCGMVDVGEGPTLMITGGVNMYETEIYHFSNNSWTFEAKSFLPRERGDNPSIHFDDTVLLVGGFDYEDYGYLDTIIEFNGEREVWMERKEKLSFPRSEATAVLVDEAVVSCG